MLAGRNERLGCLRPREVLHSVSVRLNRQSGVTRFVEALRTMLPKVEGRGGSISAKLWPGIVGFDVGLNRVVFTG